MFGLRNVGRRPTTGSRARGGLNWRNAALASAGLLAFRWWRNRQTSRKGGATQPPRPETERSAWNTAP